jgi:hypothetical protein
MPTDGSFLREEVEPYIDNLYLQSPLLKRHRDSAVIHLLRTFDDWNRVRTMKPLFEGKQLQFHATLRWSHLAIPWALRWVWNGCPVEGNASLDLDWAAYGEATTLMDLSFRYYQLCRCFILYSRGHFGVETFKDQKRIRFFFRSKAEQQRDAASQVEEIVRDTPSVPDSIFTFLDESMPVINTILPHYIDKRDEFSIRCDTPHDMLAYFKQWAILNIDEMKFDMPGRWQFGTFSLEQFRSFWLSLCTVALAHIAAHQLADEAVGTKGGAVGSVVMQTTKEWLKSAGSLFPIPEAAWHSIFELLIYEPTRKYWDPFWQPIIRALDGTLIISPHMIISSSPQRNLITLLTRSAEGRSFYDRVSSEKEYEQLTTLGELFQSPRFITRKRVSVTRQDGKTLTDIDLVVYDATDDVLLLVHAKWLIRPDTVQEVLARDTEVQSALAIAANAFVRIEELGTEWIANALGTTLRSSLKIYSVVVNQDFIPSGWVYDEQIPVVNTDYVIEFVRSVEFKGLKSLYAACAGFNEYLAERHPVKLGENEIPFGDYLFRIPTVEQATKQ